MPPGTEFFPGLRNDLYGLFTVNLGIHVPEVTQTLEYGGPKSWVQEYHCHVRARLGDVSGDLEDIWWHARYENEILANIKRRLVSGALPWLNARATRDQILGELEGQDRGSGTPPRIVMATILAKRGDDSRAVELLIEQAKGAHKGHVRHVTEIAAKLGLAIPKTAAE